VFGGCPVFGSCTASAVLFSAMLASSVLPHVGQREIGDVVGNAIEMRGCHLQFWPEAVHEGACKHVQHHLAHDAPRTKLSVIVISGQSEYCPDGFAELVVNGP